MPPGLVSFDEDIEECEELAHASDEGNHFGFSFLEEVEIEGADFGVVFDGYERGHVEGFAESATSAAGHAFSAELSAIAVDGGDTDEPGDLLAVEFAELGEIGGDDACGDRSDSWDGLDESGGVLELDIAGEQLGDFLGEGLELLLIELNRLLDETAHRVVPSAGETIAFLDQHVADLVAAGGERLQFLGIFRGGRGRRRPHPFAEEGDRMGIQAIRFGEAVEGSGEVPDLPRIDDRNGDSDALEFLDQEAFESAGGFEADQSYALGQEVLSQGGDADEVVGDCSAFVRREDAGVERLERDIDTCNGLNGGCHRWSLPCKFELVWDTAHATVRVPRRSQAAIQLLSVFATKGATICRPAAQELLRSSSWALIHTVTNISLIQVIKMKIQGCMSASEMHA